MFGFVASLPLRSVRHVRARWVCSAAPSGRGLWDIQEPREAKNRFSDGRNRSNEPRARDSYRQSDQDNDRRREPRSFERRNDRPPRRDSRTEWDTASDESSSSQGYNQRREPRSFERRNDRPSRRDSRTESDTASDESSSSQGYDRRSEPRNFERKNPRQTGRESRTEWGSASGESSWNSNRETDRREDRRNDYSSRGKRFQRDDSRQWDGNRRYDTRDRRYDTRDGNEPVSAETRLLRQALDSGDDLLYGISPTLFSLERQKRTPIQLFVHDRGAGAKKQDNQVSYEKILTLATVKEIPIQKVSRGSLNVLSGNRPHQGVVLQAGPRDFVDIKSLPHNENETWLVLDEITDPQNAGALVRSAYFLGATGIIVCKRNSSALSPVMSKASAGAMEMIDIHGVQSMPRFLKDAQEQGWKIVGMGLGSDCVSCTSMEGGGGMLVVLGSEGRGLRKMVRDCCDTIVNIEGGGEGVDSLNVSVAGGVALYQLISR